MITLALDTATPAPSVALLADDEPLIERRLPPAPGAGRRVTQELHELLRDAGVPVTRVGEIVVGLGPGGFTGLRIGIATALGLGQALGATVRGAASIEALALGLAGIAPPDAVLVPVIDAKRNEIFAAAYRAAGAGGLETVVEPAAVTSLGLAELLDPLTSAGDRAWLAGDGLHRCPDVLGSAATAAPDGSDAHWISAAALVRRVRAGGDRPVAPLYLRLPDAEVNRRRRAREAAPA